MLTVRSWKGPDSSSYCGSTELKWEKNPVHFSPSHFYLTNILSHYKLASQSLFLFHESMSTSALKELIHVSSLPVDNLGNKLQLVYIYLSDFTILFCFSGKSLHKMGTWVNDRHLRSCEYWDAHAIVCLDANPRTSIYVWVRDQAHVLSPVRVLADIVSHRLIHWKVATVFELLLICTLLDI